MGFCNDIREIRQKFSLAREAGAKGHGLSFAAVDRWRFGKAKPAYKAMRSTDDFLNSHNIGLDIRRELEGQL